MPFIWNFISFVISFWGNFTAYVPPYWALNDMPCVVFILRDLSLKKGAGGSNNEQRSATHKFSACFHRLRRLHAFFKPVWGCQSDSESVPDWSRFDLWKKMVLLNACQTMIRRELSSTCNLNYMIIKRKVWKLWATLVHAAGRLSRGFQGLPWKYDLDCSSSLVTFNP